MDTKFFIQNRKNVLDAIEADSAVVLFSGKAPKKSGDEAYAFTPNRNFYYLTGIAEQDIALLMVKCGGKEETMLFIKAPDPVSAKWVGETIKREEAIRTSGINHVCYLDTFQSTLNKYFTEECLNNVYMDLERGSFEEEISQQQRFAGLCKKRYPQLCIKNAYPLLSKLRTIKTSEEIELIKKAIEITQEGVYALMSHAKKGMYEYELEAYFDFVLKSKGVKDYAFKTIAASGKNGTVLHYHTNDSEIEENSLILFDLGAQYEYYNADITRTFPVSGCFTERQRLFYEIVLKAHDAVIAAVKPGVTLKQLNELTRKIYLEELGKLNMVKSDEEVSKYYYHSVSHFLGLDTHDVGDRNTPLAEGMVITVEPGLYIKEEAIGIRIEDDVVVTETGCEVLSEDIIRTVDEIEAYMGKNNRHVERFMD